LFLKESDMADSGKRLDQASQGAQKALPELHPTRRKVLDGVAELCRDEFWTTSSRVRKKVGISQQLLNRHLRALESDGLVALENPGPGRPLNARATSAGLQALGISETLPAEEPDPPSGQSPDQSAGQEAPSASAEPRPVIRITKRIYLFLERLYVALTPFMKDMDRGDFYGAAGPAMNLRPVKVALYQALAPSMVGVGQAEFEEIVTRLANTQPYSVAIQPPPSQQPVQPAAPVQGQEPFELSIIEKALEERLQGSMNSAYQGMPWHQRSRLMSDEWDRARRRRLGLFRTMFSSFDPRWQRMDWADFNQARRQADYCGAYYAEWVAAQFEELSPDGQEEVMPNELHGKRALTAYEEYRG
jgi:DNA-binding transcriptional ArsR family regulator